MIAPIRHPILESPKIEHGFFTRNGGVSNGIYQGLNCGPGSGDDPAHVAENRRLVCRAISGSADTPLMTAYQIHSPKVTYIDEVWSADERPKVDAMVTSRPNIVLGILTADCAPLLFSDPVAGIVGAAHAGWKGAVGGVVENTISAMEELGAKKANISAVVGPCIAHRSYEVGRDFISAATTADSSTQDFLSEGKDSDHFQFDLGRYVQTKLDRAGLKAATRLPLDTYPLKSRFFSYRRATHMNEPDYGRQISAIMIAE